MPTTILVIDDDEATLEFLDMLLSMSGYEVRTAASRHAGLVQTATATYTLGSQDRNRTLGYVLMGVGALLLGSMLHINGPMIAMAIIGAGYYVLKHR